MENLTMFVWSDKAVKTIITAESLSEALDTYKKLSVNKDDWTAPDYTVKALKGAQPDFWESCNYAVARREAA
jgi:hypothetical protein